MKLGTMTLEVCDAIGDLGPCFTFLDVKALLPDCSEKKVRYSLDTLLRRGDIKAVDRRDEWKESGSGFHGRVRKTVYENVKVARR